ncbi:putative holin [Erwinia phage Rouille]|uniref:Gp044 n=1 Tax=Erwinia phage vB_Eam-MM7 TaxID=1051674 RepID=G0YPM6_9CAUD|nr:gp044 [Erwinia phage vB_Eam-MM7]UNA01017.1 hypothetical protein 1Hena2_00067 [Erwinia phage Hena2]WJN64809.1 putative holin [Erwinia phage Rouille]WNA13692.1 hypothetical protein FIfi106_00045 [Erwinia phage FIfi106]CCA66293.1 hypothetical protein P11600430 [Erwinia phage phiEa116]AEJ81303.1 gp044 [Erwinia phage vB_Eam-MM7]
MEIKRLIENNIAAIIVGCSSVFASYLAVNVRLTQIETVQVADHQRVSQLETKVNQLEINQESMKAYADASQKNIDKMANSVDKLTESVNNLFGIVSRWQGKFEDGNHANGR